MKSGKKRSKLYLIPPTLLILIFAFAAYLFFNKGSEKTILLQDPHTTQTLKVNKLAPNLDQNSLTANSDKTLSFYTDSWSLLNSATSELNIISSDKTASLSQTFRPVEKDDIYSFLEDSPKQIENILARFYSPSSEIKCSKKECQVDGSTIDLIKTILEPSSIPGLGQEYKDYLTSPLLLVLKVKVPTSKNSYLVSIGKTAPTNIYLPYLDSSDPGATTGPLPLNGYNSSSYYISSAYGRTFSPLPLWVGSEPYRYSIEMLEKSEAILADKNYIPFLGGLGNIKDQKYVITLSNSLLTYISSPSTGCGFEAICIPGLINNKIKINNYSTVQVCDPSGNKGSLAMYRGTYELDLKKSTFLSGLYKVDPKTFPHSNRKSVLDIKGDPQPITGNYTVNFAYNYIRDSYSLKYISGERSTTALLNDWSQEGTVNLTNKIYSIC